MNKDVFTSYIFTFYAPRISLGVLQNVYLYVHITFINKLTKKYKISYGYDNLHYLDMHDTTYCTYKDSFSFNVFCNDAINDLYLLSDCCFVSLTL